MDNRSLKDVLEDAYGGLTTTEGTIFEAHEDEAEDEAEDPDVTGDDTGDDTSHSDTGDEQSQ